MGTDTKKETVAVIGLGYVGLPLALLADRQGYRVHGIGKDPKKIEQINDGVSPIADEKLTDMLKGSTMRASTDYAKAAESDIVLICVPTPVDHTHTPDLGPVKACVAELARHLRKGTLVILESTVNPGVSETVVIPELEKRTGLAAGKDFHFAHCPERINPGDPKWTVENIPRVVGGSDDEGRDRAVAFYESILDAPIKPMGSLKEAEAVKVVENSFRDINIAFVNELAMSFDKLGIDIVNVIDGAATKPFAFMPHYPGCGVGGHCIPVDPYYLIEYAKSQGFHHDFLALSRRINNDMPAFTVGLTVDALNEVERSIKNAKVALLGIAYKPGVDDDRESPYYEIRKLLEEKGALVKAYDPYLPKASELSGLDEAFEYADLVLLATNHREFLELDCAAAKRQGVLALVDGRNMFNPAAVRGSGLAYRGIGR